MRSKSWVVRRRRFSVVERVGLLSAYHRSRVTQREFVEQHALSLATLTKWLRQEREATKTPRGKSPRFAELPLTPVLGTARWAAEVVRPDGWTVRLAHDVPGAWMEQLLAAC